jgi:hypothetical protein
MRAISAMLCSILATALVATFVSLIAPQVNFASKLQAEAVCKRLVKDVEELWGSQTVYVGNAIVEVRADRVAVSFLGQSEEEPMSKTGIPSIGGTVVVLGSDGYSAWIKG